MAVSCALRLSCQQAQTPFSHFLYQPMNIKTEVPSHGYEQVPTSTLTFQSKFSSIFKRCKTDFSNIPEESQLTSWTKIHPQHWTREEVLDWVYYVVDQMRLDGSLVPGEAYQSITGQRLCQMTRSDFHVIDPVYGARLYDVFCHLLKDVNIRAPKLVEDSAAISNFDDFTEHNNNSYNNNYHHHTRWSWDCHGNSTGNGLAMAISVCPQPSPSSSSFFGCNDSSKNRINTNIVVYGQDNDVKVGIGGLGVYSISTDIEFPSNSGGSLRTMSSSSSSPASLSSLSSTSSSSSSSLLLPPRSTPNTFSSPSPAPSPSFLDLPSIDLMSPPLPAFSMNNGEKSHSHQQQQQQQQQQQHHKQQQHNFMSSPFSSFSLPTPMAAQQNHHHHQQQQQQQHHHHHHHHHHQQQQQHQHHHQQQQHQHQQRRLTSNAVPSASSSSSSSSSSPPQTSSPLLSLTPHSPSPSSSHHSYTITSLDNHSRNNTLLSPSSSPPSSAEASLSASISSLARSSMLLSSAPSTLGAADLSSASLVKMDVDDADYISDDDLFVNCPLSSDVDMELEVTNGSTPYPEDIILSTATGQFMHDRKRRRSKGGHTNKGTHLWEFVRDLLRNPTMNPKILKWEDKETGVFRFVQSETVAQLWGEKKKNPMMTYEKLSRAMRFCRSAGYFNNVPKNGKFPKKLCFMFGDKAQSWKE